MRTIPVAIALTLAACAASHETSFNLRYDGTPRSMVWDAIEATRKLHYSIVAVESPDVFHNAFLAIADGTPAKSPLALRIEISTAPSTPKVTRNGTGAATTLVQVTAMKFVNGEPVRDTEVPAQTRADAERLTLAIDQQTRGNRIY
jgi:hypothetical protein